MIQADIQVGRD